MKPDIIKGVTVSKEERSQLEVNLSNWRDLHLFMTELKESDNEEETLRKLLLIEYEGRSRWDIMGRLKGRINRVRSDREGKELLRSK